MKDISPEIKNDTAIRKNIYDNIYGFIVRSETKLELFKLNISTKTFENTEGNIKKILENKKNILYKTPPAKLFGFLKYDKHNSAPVFKITDNISKGAKKSVRGLKCSSKPASEIKDTLVKLNDKILKTVKKDSKFAFCNDVEILLRRNDILKKDGKKWFYTPEEQYIYFEYGIN